MIQFIDKEGNLFNGSKPYIHWFDESLSVGLKYSKSIIFLSELNYVSCTIEDNNYIKLVNQDKLGLPSNKTEINDKEYNELDKITSNNITSIGYQLPSAYNNLYLHIIYFIADGVDVGEVICDFTIDNENYQIGVDIFETEETHKINLLNQGIQIPDAFTKTLYDTNVREEYSDHITINRKLKELLLEGMNIIHKKGSYASLIDSVNWFEWGDNLSLREFWKDKNHNSYLYNEVKQEMSVMMDNIINSYSKTTYIGLYGALDKIKTKNGKTVYEHYQMVEVGLDGTLVYPITVSGGDPINPNDPAYDHELTLGDTNGGEVTIGDYPDPSNPPIDSEGTNLFFDSPESPYFMSEPIPEITAISHKWSVLDLQLKMTLLGNFFSTYFLPLHMDLLHSTIENLVYTNCIKIYENGKVNRVDFVDNLNSWECSLDNPNNFYYMKDNAAAVTNKTLLGIDDVYVLGSRDNYYNADVIRLTYDTQPYGVSSVQNTSNTPMTTLDLKKFLSQYRSTPMCLLPVHIDAHGKEIKNIILTINKLVDGKWISVLPPRIFSTNVLNIDSDGVPPSSFDFNILLDKIGSYKIGLSLVDFFGAQYPRQFDINVIDRTINDFKLCKLVRKDWDRSNLTFPVDTNWYNTEDWLFSTPGTYEYNERGYYNQILPKDINPQTSYLTHVCVTKLITVENNDADNPKNYAYELPYVYSLNDDRFIDRFNGENAKVIKLTSNNTTDNTMTKVLASYMHGQTTAFPHLAGYVWSIRELTTVHPDSSTTTEGWLYGVKKTFGDDINNSSNLYVTYGKKETCNKNSNYIDIDNNIYPYYNQYTFFPSLFTPKELSLQERLNVKMTDVLQLIPNIKLVHNYIYNTSREPLWKIECVSDIEESTNTNKVGYNHNIISPIIYLNNNPKSIGNRKGYYNIYLNYMLDSTLMNKTFNSAFVING